ncbi:MAG: hypothetical protein FJX11_02030 [Alphaproteobacteria bacterium]|nr:hypothetical protein [Alphaproteobacteria bacterium]
MGLLLKIILFGVAVWAAWKTFHRWKSLFDRFVGKPDPPPAAPRPPPAEPLPVRRGPVEDTVQCAGCGAYLPASAEKCSQCGRPQPQGRSST